jgi:hypothetical protein
LFRVNGVFYEVKMVARDGHNDSGKGDIVAGHSRLGVVDCVPVLNGVPGDVDGGEGAVVIDALVGGGLDE